MSDGDRGREGKRNRPKTMRYLAELNPSPILCDTNELRNSFGPVFFPESHCKKPLVDKVELAVSVVESCSDVAKLKDTVGGLDLSGVEGGDVDAVEPRLPVLLC